jgi:hypothetical protein
MLNKEVSTSIQRIPIETPSDVRASARVLKDTTKPARDRVPKSRIGFVKTGAVPMSGRKATRKIIFSGIRKRWQFNEYELVISRQLCTGLIASPNEVKAVLLEASFGSRNGSAPVKVGTDSSVDTSLGASR